LVPFNSAFVIQKLPILVTTPPRPAPMAIYPTPHNPKMLMEAIAASKVLLKGLEKQSSELELISGKICKAASTAFADRTILSFDNDDMRAHNQQKMQKATRKRKRIIGNGGITIGAIDKELAPVVPPPFKRTAWVTCARKRAKTPSPEPTSDEESYTTEGTDVDSDISCCIVLALLSAL
jgi:hypothetical protein